MRKFTVYVMSILLCFSFAKKIEAQETTSEIAGIVTDGNKPVAGATVTALNVPTGTKYATTTRNDGRYNLPNLRVGGPYTLTVSYVGYKEEKQENINLLLGQEFKADFTLTPEAASLTDVVVKSASTNKIFNNNHTGSQEIISRSQIERLPTINRSLQDFTRLTPSANGLSFGGRNSAYNNVTVDGANFNNAFGLSSVLGGQTNSQPISIDAIEQIQVNVSPYDVRQGSFAGTGINSVTRSGTNTFKGSVYTYLQNPGLQGRKVGTVEVPKPDFDYNLRGFSLGGAIVKNKLFFFISGEQERVTQPGTNFIANTSGGTASGNISQAVADTLDALRNFLVKNYNYDPGQYQNYTYKTQSDKITAKLDWNINSNNTFTIKYNYLKSSRDIAASNSGAPQGNRQPSSTGLPFSGSGYTINNNFNIVIAELNTRFSNKASNKLQVGYTALRDFRASLSGGDFPLVDILNGSGFSYTAFGFEPFTYNNKLNTDIYQLSDIFTLYKGAHEITFGTQNYYKKFLNGFAPNYDGFYQFNTLSDFYNSAMNGTANAARYELRYSALPDASFPFAKIGAYELGVFAQDKWKIRNNLTVTYGLRVDLPIFENKFQANDSLAALTFRDGVKIDVGQKPKTTPLFSPRVGFNWDVTGNQSTQVRGGVGIFAGPPPFVWVSNQASNNGVQFGSFVKTSGVAFTPDVNAYRPGAGAAANTSYNIAVTSKDFKYPQVLKTSLGVDQKLPGGLTGTVEYVYSKDINAVYFQNVNLPSTGTPLAGSDNRLRYSSKQIYSGAGGATQSNPNISDAIVMTNANKGYAYTLTFQLQKNFKNLYLNAAYTYSDARTLNDGGSIAQSMWRDRVVSNDPNAPELGYGNFYQPNRFIFSASYRKEYADHFATSVGLVFEMAPAGVSSYTINGDLNNDGLTTNDLMYIPKDQTDIVLVPLNGGSISKDNVSADHSDTRTASQLWNQLNNYINQDSYLAEHRGQVAKRNGVVMPYFKRIDLNVTQDVYFFTGKEKTKHTLRLTFDMINLGNFLNKDWGTYQTFNRTALLKYEGLDETNHPQYSFPYLDAKNQIPLTNTYKDNTSIFSRWQGQIGIRYLFN